MKILSFPVLAPVIFYFVSVIVLIGMFTYLHEDIHQKIYRDYGIDSKVEYGLIKSTTTPIMPVTSNKTNQCNDICEQSHEFNEIVGYHVQVILGAMTFGIFFWWFVTEVRRVEDEYK